jgi:hypothetical protein
MTSRAATNANIRPSSCASTVFDSIDLTTDTHQLLSIDTKHTEVGKKKK